MTRAELQEALTTRTREMRAAQKAYFAAARANRFRGDELATAQRLEREVDALLAPLPNAPCSDPSPGESP